MGPTIHRLSIVKHTTSNHRQSPPITANHLQSPPITSTLQSPPLSNPTSVLRRKSFLRHCFTFPFLAHFIVTREPDNVITLHNNYNYIAIVNGFATIHRAVSRLFFSKKKSLSAKNLAWRNGRRRCVLLRLKNALPTIPPPPLGNFKKKFVFPFRAMWFVVVECCPFLMGYCWLLKTKFWIFF